MLQLHIGFPSGKYCAASIDDARQPEWPPHPSRVFSALVAASYAGERQPPERERHLLERIEQSGPPLLVFPAADTQAGEGDVYVPVNDLPSRFGPKSYGALFPNKQPRHFPSSYLLGSPEVVLGWPLELDQEDLCTLDELAARVTHVGTSHSLVTAHFTMSEAKLADAYEPSPRGILSVRVPLPGRLLELDELHAQPDRTVRRPQPRCEEIVTYIKSAAEAPRQHTSAFDWLVFRFQGASWGADTAYNLGKCLRRAVMSLLDQQAPAAVHGHDDDQLHVAWLPLPDVGHAHASGKVLGIGVAIPHAQSAEERALTLAALARLPYLRLPDGQVAQLEPVTDSVNIIRALRDHTWTGSSRHWSTVTPILLDRPPKRSTPEKVALAVTESLVNAGYPRPVSVTLNNSSDFEGGPSTHEVPTKLPRIHARVVFAEPVQGPVIAGRWKYFGVGLFRPTPEDLRS
jgi:CRISPR-associated protein Csb2